MKKKGFNVHETSRKLKLLHLQFTKIIKYVNSFLFDGVIVNDSPVWYTDRSIYKADIQAGRQSGRQTFRQADIQAGRQSGTSRQAYNDR